MSRHSSTRKKEKKNRLVLYTFLVFIIVAAICAGVIFAVIFMPSSEQTLKAPTSPTPPSVQTTESAAPSPSPTPEATSEPEEATSNPVFTKAVASSTREPYRTETGTVTYPPSSALDNNKSTVWTPDPDEDNPWIELSATSPQTVKGIEILNGYAKSKKLYEANSRAKDVIVECNGVRYSYTLQDKGAGKVQRLAFPEPMDATKIRITISSEYEGKEYEDLCISEITPY